MTAALGVTVITAPFLKGNRVMKNLHTGAGVALVALSLWHHFLYQPEKTQSQVGSPGSREKGKKHPSAAAGSSDRIRSGRPLIPWTDKAAPFPAALSLPLLSAPSPHPLARLSPRHPGRTVSPAGPLRAAVPGALPIPAASPCWGCAARSRTTLSHGSGSFPRDRDHRGCTG